MIITIDGPVATGKSTIARKLAEELGYIYFDTGAMYRALTWFAMQQKCNVDEPLTLEELLDDFNFEIKIKRKERLYYVNKQEVTKDIRSAEVTALVSKIAAKPVVRERLVAIQRQFSEGVNAVFEGRDMGSVVFPHAHLKIFLTAKPEVRAKRRFHELQILFPAESENLTLETALENLNARDTYDSTRQTSPLIRAHDAYEIDTSDLTIDEVVMKILELKDSKKISFNMKNSH
jgi:cytidylate kinase